MLHDSLESICELLLSNKVRDRNEALERLQDINFSLPSTVNLINHELLIKVVNCLDVFLNSDIIIYEKSKANSVVEARLNKASSILRVLITHVWGNPKFISLYKPRQSEKLITIMLKHFTFDPLDEGTQVCDPVILNMSKSLNFLLSIQCFKDHMFSSTYELILDKTIACLNMILLDSYNSSKNENITIELLSVIHQFICPNNTSDLRVLKKANKDYYNKSFEFCLLYYKNVFSDNRRDRETLIFIFRIINKCIITLSSENVKLCYQFYKLGMRYILEVKAITSLKLVSEIAIFINIIPPFMNLNNLPRLPGDNWNIDLCGELIPRTFLTKSSRVDGSESSIIFSAAIKASSEADESIVLSDSQGSDSDTISKKRGHNVPLDPDSDIVDIGKLFEIVFCLVNDNTYRRHLELNNESVKFRLISIPKKQTNLFNFKNLYFRDGYSPIPWLLRLGLNRILMSFFSLHPEVTSLGKTKTKRFHRESSKFDDSFRISEHLFYFDNPMSFFVSILADDPYGGGYESLVLSQMFTLFLGYIQLADDPSDIEILLKSTNNEVEILTQLIDTFERNNHNVKFWLFYAAATFHMVCFMHKFTNSKETNIEGCKAFEKMIKYSLEFLKEPLMSKLACTFLSNISLCYFTINSTKISIKKPILQQYQNVIELSEINGPCHVNKESILFWITSSFICKSYNFTSARLFNTSSNNDMNLFSNRVANWFSSKVDSLNEIFVLDDVLLLVRFVKWLLGETVLILPHETVYGSDLYIGEQYILFESVKNNTKVCDYFLQRNSTINDESDVFLTSVTTMKLSTNFDIHTRIITLFSNFIDSTFFIDELNWVTWTICTTHLFRQENGLLHLDRWKNTLMDRFKNFKDPDELKLMLKLYYDCMLMLSSNTRETLTHIIPQCEIIELTIYLLNSGKNSKRLTDVVDLFDPFIESSHYKSTVCFPDYHSYRSHLLTLSCSKLEQKAMLFVLRLYDSSLAKSVEAAISFSSRIELKFQFLATQYELMKFFKNENPSIAESLLDQLYSHTTLLLEAHETKMFESSLIVITDLFERFTDTWIKSSIGIEADGKALYDFLTNIDSRNMLHTEDSAVIFFKLVAKLSIYSSNFDIGLSQEKLYDNMIERFCIFSNLQLFNVALIVKDCIKGHSTEQLKIYSLFVESFSSPQQTIERSAMFCYFMVVVSQSAESLTIASICNLLQLSQFDQICAYIKSAIADISAIIGVNNVNVLFWNFKEVFLRCWEGFGMSITSFPYILFGFSSMTQFYRKCYKEILALSLAYNKLDVVPCISKSILMKESSMINDSMALSITFSWMKGGVRNKVFKNLETYYKSSKMLKTNINDQFILVIYNLLKFCDCSIEADIFSAFDSTIKETASLFTKSSTKIVFLEEYDIYIKPKSCVDMIKYFSDTCVLDEIWTSSFVYHLVSKVLLLIENSIFKTEKMLHVRRLKLLMILGVDQLSDCKVSELIVTNIAPSLNTSYLIDETAPIIKLILKIHSVAKSNLSIYTCFVLLDVLLHLERNSITKQIAETLVTIVTKDQFQQYYDIYMYALKSYTELSFSFDINIEDFINRACSNTFETDAAVKLLSTLFEVNEEFQSRLSAEDNHSCTQDFIQNLYIVNTKFGLSLSAPMLLWIGRRLATYYQYTGKCPQSQNYEFDSYMLQSSNNLDFGSEVKSLNTIFIPMINDTKSCSLKEKYCFETIAGVIICKQKASMDNLNSVLSYDDLFLPMESYIHPIGNYLCSLLIEQVEDASLSYYKNSLDQVLNGFTALIEAYKFKDWMPKILFSLINELSSQTPIIILLATYICHIPKFAIKCFCPLILYYVENQPLKRIQSIAKMIREFFEQDYKSFEIEAIEIFIELVLLIRLGNKNANDKFISLLSNVDILLVVDAALHIKKFKTALMLYEDHISKRNGNVDDVTFNKEIDTERLKIIYSGLEDMDLIAGLPIIPKLQYGMQSLKVNSSWGEMMFSNAVFDSSLRSGDRNMSQSMHEISHGMMNMGWVGASNIVSEFFRNKIDTALPDDDQLYEQLWKLNQWDIPVTEEPKTENQYVYSLLRGIKEDPKSGKTLCNTLVGNLLKLNKKNFGRFNDTSTERLESWMRTLSICFSIEDIFSSSEELSASLDKFWSSTEWFNNATCNEFENILLSRCSLLEIMGHTETSCLDEDITDKRNNYWGAIVSELHKYNSLMISKKQIQKSINASVMLDKISKNIFASKNIWINRVAKFNLAQSFWIEKSDTRFPIETLKDIIQDDMVLKKELQKSSLNNNEPSSFKISTNFLLATLSQWCDESKQETSTTLMETYVSEITQSYIKSPELCYERDTGLTYHIIARLCDDQISKNQDDSLMQKLSHSITLLEQDISALTKYVKEDNFDEAKKKYAIQDLNRLKMRHKTQSKELTSMKKERKNYAIKAVSFYFKSIAFRNHNFIETDIDRFCSLWIEHNDIPLNESELLSLPTSNFVPWSNQLVSRLLDEKSTFQELLKKLIINVAYSHPFHTLYLLKSLRLIKNETDDNAAVSRGTAAEQIWNILFNSSKKFNVEGFHHIVESIDAFADKSVDIANIKLKNTKKISLLKLPDGKWWKNDLSQLGLPSPVKNIEIRENYPYRASELPIMLKVSEIVTTASSGVSHPKIMKFLLSTGETQKMLMKAPDDLRQDSIMKQVFEKVNRLLRQDIETRKRKLRIVTYNVLPLGPTSGILEFVPNSMPLVDILKSLHKHDPMDINEARMKMKEVQTQSKSVRYQTYKEICKKIKPCLKDFFFNNFTLPDTWFNSRTLYCHGIATTSITGYILGIGDRHCNNILLDKSSGEPIHIDFGIAFDQGKLLPIPETVPFRLTRDIVDGMGVTKVNGIFSKSCEHVMRVLRINTQYIASILDVLKYDPLYSWTLSPLRKKKLQQVYYNDDENNVNLIEEFLKSDIGSEANNAIETVKKKLEAKGLSDEAIVRELIREAVDTRNLCLIFMGWSPFL